MDIAVIETGLGGRLDATNVLEPCLTITTDISRDHTEILGSTVPTIAREKAGIIKPSVPHLIGLLPQQAVRVMRDTCKKRRAALCRLRKSRFKFDSKRSRLSYNGEAFTYSKVSPSLIGEHQLHNCALVLKAVDVLSRNGFSFSKVSVKRGLASTEWPGRFHIIRQKGQPTMVLDVCHNVAGTVAFVDTFLRRFPGKKTAVILGLVKRKEHRRIVNSLSRIAASFQLVPLKTRRSVDPDELVLYLNRSHIPVRKFRSLGTAYSTLLKSVGPDDIITVIGSHYLVGEFLESCVEDEKTAC